MLMLLLAWGTLAFAAAKPSSARPAPAFTPGQSEFRAAWIAFAGPITKPLADRTGEARQVAREAAIPHLEAAVAAAPNNSIYHASLAHVCLTAGKYDKALAAINRALALERGNPWFYLLRGQAQAALAQLKPEEAAKNIGPAMTALSRAAELDPKNALPLLQAASVAIDVGRADLALDNLKKALSRSECRLYRLPVPEDLGADGPSSLSTWEYAEYEHWFGLIARCQNVAGYCLRSGKEAEEKGNLAGAEERYRWARHVASYVGIAEPRLFITATAAVDILEGTYTNLVRVGEAAGSKDSARWKGELGICQFAREQLLGALQLYQRDVAGGAITSVSRSLETQAELVTPAIAGVGLPIRDPAAAPAKPR